MKGKKESCLLPERKLWYINTVAESWDHKGLAISWWPRSEFGVYAVIFSRWLRRIILVIKAHESHVPVDSTFDISRQPLSSADEI